jgi:prepilin signal peptidase PulO-like enzyme (type II secretory pathway)
MTAALFALSYLVFPPAVTVFGLMRFFALLVFLSASIGIVAYDIRHTLVPMPFAYVLIGSAGVYRALEAWTGNSVNPLLDALAGGVLVGGFFAIISLVTRGRGMGIGDAYIAGAVGILLGLVGGITATTLGVWSATALYLLLMLSSRIGLFRVPGRVTMKTELPFAPWLLFGCALVLFTGVSVLDFSTWLPIPTT